MLKNSMRSQQSFLHHSLVGMWRHGKGEARCSLAREGHEKVLTSLLFLYGM